MTSETDKGKSYQHKSKVLHLGLKENKGRLSGSVFSVTNSWFQLRS